MSSDLKTTEMAGLLREVREKRPLVHCITNYVTVNDCANALLAVGAAPVMADDIGEVDDIAALAGALVINIGTLNARTIQSMLAAGRRAAALNLPVVLDPVGAGASALRTQTACDLLRSIPFAVIRGNVSEIKALMGGGGTTRGVDADEKDWSSGGLDGVIAATSALARRTGAVVAVTGVTDVVSDGSRALAIRNGHAMMSRITGSGCMLSAVIGAFCGAAPDRTFDAVGAAIAAMGLAGEQAAARAAKERTGTGSFRTYLIDSLSLMDEAVLAGGMKLERRA